MSNAQLVPDQRCAFDARHVVALDHGCALWLGLGRQVRQNKISVLRLIRELIEGFDSLCGIHEAGTGAHVEGHPHRLHHLIAGRAFLDRPFGMKGHAAVAADRHGDGEGDQFLGFLRQVRPAWSQAYAIA